MARIVRLTTIREGPGTGVRQRISGTDEYGNEATVRGVTSGMAMKVEETQPERRSEAQAAGKTLFFTARPPPGGHGLP
jgi:hypothetical protein